MTDASFSASKNEGRRRQTPQQVEWVRDASVGPMYFGMCVRFWTSQRAAPYTVTIHQEEGLKASPLFIDLKRP